MPRYKELFTLFPRKMPSGKVIWYYRIYDNDGIRSTAHSTGLSNKTQARNYCQKMYSKGLLVPSSDTTFIKYAKYFFDEGSQWYNDKLQLGKGKAQPIAKSTLVIYQRFTRNILIPYFKNMKMCNILPRHIRELRDYMINRNYSNSAINMTFNCLKIIFTYAITDKVIVSNPMITIKKMYINARAKSAFSIKELRQIIGEIDNPVRKTFVITAALTGMRISEICGIRKESLLPEYIDVSYQFLWHSLLPVKDGSIRKIRICNKLYQLLLRCVEKSGDYAFPECDTTYRSTLNEASGLSLNDRKEQGLTFHSIRHFFNTYLLKNGVSEIKVKTIMGHSSGKGSITERYTNFTPEDFDEVAILQERLLDELGITL